MLFFHETEWLVVLFHHFFLLLRNDSYRINTLFTWCPGGTEHMRDNAVHIMISDSYWNTLYSEKGYHLCKQWCSSVNHNTIIATSTLIMSTLVKYFEIQQYCLLTCLMSMVTLLQRSNFLQSFVFRLRTIFKIASRSWRPLQYIYIQYFLKCIWVFLILHIFLRIWRGNVWDPGLWWW